MPTLPIDYYADSTKYGEYQYVSLNDMVTNYILNYTGDDKLINNVSRYNVLFHFKRGLQELNYDALKEVKSLMLEIGEDLTFVLPNDYVNHVRVSWLDDNGKFRPMLTNNKSALATEYLQDNEYDIIFDNDGYPITTDSDSIDFSLSNNTDYNIYECDKDYVTGAQFYLDGSVANVNGIFMINKRAGVIEFSSNVVGKQIILEYISDGLEYGNSTDVKINKLAEQALYDYVSFVLLDTKIGVQEYIVTRYRKKYRSSRKLAKSRIDGFRYNELLQVLRGKANWIK